MLYFGLVETTLTLNESGFDFDDICDHFIDINHGFDFYLGFDLDIDNDKALDLENNIDTHIDIHFDLT